VKETFCLICDDDGHWYVIPVGRKRDFLDAVSKPYVELPAWAISVGGDPSLVSFEGYRIFERN
jgi:hypothetical protein